MDMSVNEPTKECNACEIALGAWSENYVEAGTLEIPEVVFTLTTEVLITEIQTALTFRVHQIYRPPPQVILANAFHIPQRSTVIIV